MQTDIIKLPKNCAQHKKHIIKMEVLLLNGGTQDWEMHLPPISQNFDLFNYGALYMEAFLLDMQRHYLQVRSYKAEFFIEENGERTSAGRWYDARHIPADKVYLPCENIVGKWLPYGEARRIKRERETPHLAITP